MNANSPDKITLDASGIELNNNTLINSSSNKQVTLSSSESLILEHLVMNSPKAIGRDFLLEHCWPGRVVTGSSLNVAIKNIRTALNELNCECKILTVQKQGYSFSRPQQLGGYLSTPISAIQTQVAQVNVPNETVELEVFNTDSDRSDDSKSESVLPQQRELHKQRRVKSFLTRHQSRIVGMVVSALLLVLFYQFVFFMDKTSYRGMDVYHDSLNFDQELLTELNTVSELGVDSLYLHRIGVGCQNIQAVALINGRWKEMSHQFKSLSCDDDNDDERG
ncbi:transcriptional regulator [Vibrio sp. 10N.222.48.F6]|jgi:DNA-binding winged helix-turn-helix (wHTH) protein|uniref:Helix-turn-helix domain-containing protein n=1 Tax=Vibrio tasmaniensis TaxID=212663 RepID=A0AB38NVT8_9VIBR|nr:winged helix-turn-helix domain-containing protein [Vibrio tasmaniensis]TKG36855.1 helix-turn-helix domain-containing protein [Vibrio tasmaniensis]TKG38601.1 helix-turn-helix domain-containing protein [Vibrio tasmaniensis]TKG44049.1 helix-turn-helix domain-containing protein [Vibrio tasmaniensis]TKG49586.1 helix-turn-helix domain-containing protein [Vibrio tasmaniensis]TKG51666.1 helix-turn-helix domain-containing protein [Vibrio tasmaniensis]